MDHQSNWRRLCLAPTHHEHRRTGRAIESDVRASRGCTALAAILLIYGMNGARADSDGDKTARPSGSRPVNFAREVRPILADHCFACHGPDDQKRKGGLRFDTREGAFGKSKSGETAIVPGKPDESELVARIESDDAEVRMPPPKGGKPLTKDQIGVLKRWVLEGAVWSSHWAFEPPKKPQLPAVKNAGWAITEIDRLILARLESEGLAPAPEADKTTLIRRATLDLTGLPPTLKEVDAFLADSSARAYERVVDRLLDSPRYGEHMARYWLDAARYGDTHGLHLDNYREAWTYRDWVVRAFNDNKPFDRFIVEQLAGDLLPGATLDQIIATGFNRCHVSTNEGGSIEEEVYVRNIVDQVDTNGTVFLGLTTGCARCHDHKYDPIRMKDYYQLFAFFNNIDGPPMDGNGARWEPVVKVPAPDQASVLKSLEAQVAEVGRKIASQAAAAVAAYDLKADSAKKQSARRGDFVWIDDSLPIGAKEQGDGPWEYAAKPGVPSQSADRALKITALGRKQRFFDSAGRRLKVGAGDTLFAYVYIDPHHPCKELMLQWHTSGWTHRAYWGANLIDWGTDRTPERMRMGDLPAAGKWVRLEVPVARLKLKKGEIIDGWAFTQFDGTVFWDTAGLHTEVPQDGQRYESFALWAELERASGAVGLPDNVKKIMAIEPSKRTDAQTKELLGHFIARAYGGTAASFEALTKQLDELEQKRKRLDEQVPATLVFRERAGKPKPAYMLKRGEYDQRGEQVERAVPAFLPPLPPSAPRDRLGLAQWLIAPNHPLTARVTVNRLWQQVFGTGIVKTAEDFGAQGEPPSHPELLDWLAVQFRDDGWDAKRFMKRLTMSAVYRQSSRATAEILAKDPSNRLYARGPRFRLDAEMLRDQALFASGLLIESMGGPSVKLPQPAGLWEAVAYTDSNTAHFLADTGSSTVHRRSLYTFWKRTAPPPQMTTFDAPSRESCQVRRERTNTPLQALVLLNEGQYLEAARGLAERALREAGKAPDDRLMYLFRLATSRCPDATELAELKAAYAELHAHYARSPEAAQKLLSPGEPKAGPLHGPADLAAWTMIGNVILNLDEVITK
jgi:hypothetical protein